MATATDASELGQFFDFGGAAVSEMPLNVTGDAPVVQESSQCPVHGADRTAESPSAECKCAQDGNPSLGEDVQPTAEAEWNPDFSSWLPRYSKPAHPCHYCASRGLECFIFNFEFNPAVGKRSGCSPCNALFRPCSFSDPDKMPILKTKTALDTLDVVTEDMQQCFGGRTGRKPMRVLGHAGPMTDDLLIPEGTRKGTATRFSRDVVKILKNWLIQHIDHPYPTEEEKEALKRETGLSIGQISNWMANTRRRQKARPKRNASPSIRPSTEPVNIPPGRTWDDLNPLERWKHSPPENEPAPLTAIAQAVETFDPPEPNSLSSSYTGRKNNSNDSTGSFSVFRAPSTTSLETGFTNMSSGSVHSYGSAYSYGSRNSIGSLNSLNSKKERRRRRRLPTRAPKLDLDNNQRMFQCTFCTDRFKSKYDWSRHEKSLHLSLEKWICAPLGDVITCTASGRRKCVYCDAFDPSKEHLATHNHNCCEEKGLEARTFYRKDHLRQHLRLMHGCKMTPSMESWKAEVQYINSRCGFCSMKFTKWQDRVDHLAKEFRNGAMMKDWKGCRGLDANVAVHVTNAMPPYLIGNECKSPIPFSATNLASISVHSQHLFMARGDLEYLLPNPPSAESAPCHTGDTSMSNSSHSPNGTSQGSPQNKSIATGQGTHPNPHPNATCWEILTLRLGQFARLHIENHGAATLDDETIQAEARRILYDSDDPWNQTAADNPEWLALFKKAHGLDRTAATYSKPHDILENLGLGPNAQLDQSFDINNFTCGENGQGFGAYECSLAGSMNLTQAAKAFQNLNFETNHTCELTYDTPPTSSFDQVAGVEAPIYELMCTTPGGICIGENGELGFSVKKGNATTTAAQENAAKQSFFLPDNPISSSVSVDANDVTAGLSAQQTPDPFTLADFSDWAQLPASMAFSLPNTTTAGLSTSLPVDMSAGTSTAGAGVVQGDIGNPQVMRWDDNDLDFGMDLDLDLDVDMNIGMGSGSS